MLFINLAFYLEGRYLKSYEYEFLQKVEDDVKCFEKSCHHRSSFLVFPPLRSRLRYLAHTFLDEFFFPRLCSFSVGQEEKRRLIVGLTSNVVRCSLPYECIHKKIFHISKTPEKLSSCTCLDRIKLLLHQDSEFASFMSACGYLEKGTECNDSVKSMSQMKERRVASLRDRHRRPDKQLYVPRPLRRNEAENISAVKEQVVESVYSSKKYQNNDSCRKPSHFTDSSKTVRHSSCLTKDESKLKTDPNTNEKSLDMLNSHHSDDLSRLKRELQVDEKSLHKLNSDHNMVLAHDLHAGIHNKEEISCNINMNEEDKQCIENAAQLINMTKDNNIDSNVDFEKQDIKSPEDFTLNECVNNSELQQQVDSISASYEPDNYLERDLASVSNAVKIQNEVVNDKDCAKQMIACPAENVADSWETIFNDDGECLDPKFVEELCDITGRIQTAVAKNDYSDYQPLSDCVSEEYSNIVELYGFPVEFSTQDLTSAFSIFQEASYSIKWVDDCHALAVFSSPVIASQALHLNHPFIKVRPLSEGIKESKEKARFCARMSEACKPRPVTSAALARRLVSGALGLKVNTSKEQRDFERNMLRDAREKKKLKAKQRQDIWNGIVS